MGILRDLSPIAEDPHGPPTWVHETRTRGARASRKELLKLLGPSRAAHLT
jgi:hypothetical protein